MKKMVISSMSTYKTMNAFLVVLILLMPSGGVAAEPGAFTVSSGGKR